MTNSIGMAATDGELLENVNWRVELQGDTDIEGLAAGVQENESALSVDVCIHDTMSKIPSIQIVSLFENLGSSLNGLRRLEFYPGEGNYNFFPIEALLAVIQESANLEILYVYHLELHGDVSIFQSFATQLTQRHSMKEVCFIDCRLSTNQAASRPAFDPVVRSLASLPSLKVVALWADDLGDISADSLTVLCQSSSIERLMIQGFPINDKDLSAMCHELERNENLRRLNVSCSLGPSGCSSIAQMLQRNSNLEKLQIDFDEIDNEEDLIEIATGLKRNSTMNYLKFSGPGIVNDEILKAYESMLECNLCLRALSIFDGCLKSTKIDFYLKLNSCGRQAVFQARPEEWNAWFEALVNANGDIDCVFYFLLHTDRIILAQQN